MPRLGAQASDAFRTRLLKSVERYFGAPGASGTLAQHQHQHQHRGYGYGAGAGARVGAGVRETAAPAATGATVTGKNQRMITMDVVYKLMTGDTAGSLDDPEWQLKR